MGTRVSNVTNTTAGIEGGPRRRSRRLEGIQNSRERVLKVTVSLASVFVWPTALAGRSTRLYHVLLSSALIPCACQDRRTLRGCAGATFPLHQSCSTGTLGRLVGESEKGHGLIRVRDSASVRSHKTISDKRLDDGYRDLAPRRGMPAPWVGSQRRLDCKGMSFARRRAHHNSQGSLVP